MAPFERASLSATHLGTQMPHVRVPRLFQPIPTVRSVEARAACAAQLCERGVAPGQATSALVTRPLRRILAHDVVGVARHVLAHRGRGFGRHRRSISSPEHARVGSEDTSHGGQSKHCQTGVADRLDVVAFPLSLFLSRNRRTAAARWPVRPPVRTALRPWDVVASVRHSFRRSSGGGRASRP